MKKFFVLFFVLLGGLTAKAGIPYRGYVDISFGNAYNFNTAQTVSTNNMQLYGMASTMHGIVLKNWFLGAGVGYYHSFRDQENMFPLFLVVRNTYDKLKVHPYIEARAGTVYDPLWERKLQVYGTLGAGISIHKKIQLGVRLSAFSRPSRYFTANAAVAVSYSLGQ